MSTISRRGALRIGVGSSDMVGSEHGDPLDLVEEDLIQLTTPIPYTRDEDMPLRMCRHTVGGGGLFTRLLRKVAWVIVCYSEHRHDN